MPSALFVFGSMREMLPAALFATQTASAPTAIAVGPFSHRDRVSAAAVVRIDPSDRVVRRVRHPNHFSGRDRGRPVADVKRIGADFGERRRAVPRNGASPELATQMEPLPTTIPAGSVPGARRLRHAARYGSIRARVESPKTAQIEPKPTATLPLGEPKPFRRRGSAARPR